MELSGCGTALVTPFRKDSSLDEPSLRALVDWQIVSGINFLIPCGTTGEASTLSEPEWLRVIELTIAAAAGRVPIFAGCTHNATSVAVAKAKQLAQLPGLTGILTANPYYNRPSQEGQYQHFRAIAEATPLPVLLYNIPARTGVNLEPATLLRLTAIANIIGVKESSGNLDQIKEIIANAPKRFRIFAGDDSMALPVIEAGGVGLISVASLAHNWPEARDLHQLYADLMKANFCEPSPAPAKAMLHLLGRAEETVRLPIVPVSAENRAKLQSLLSGLGLLGAN
jgi:4-hydroxy-tetrahydrodipicolinate synthase